MNCYIYHSTRYLPNCLCKHCNFPNFTTYHRVSEYSLMLIYFIQYHIEEVGVVTQKPKTLNNN